MLNEGTFSFDNVNSPINDARHFVNKVPAMMDQKLKITRPRNPPYIGLSQDCHTVGAQPSMMGSIYYIFRIHK